MAYYSDILLKWATTSGSKGLQEAAAIASKKSMLPSPVPPEEETKEQEQPVNPLEEVQGKLIEERGKLEVARLENVVAESKANIDKYKDEAEVYLDKERKDIDHQRELLKKDIESFIKERQSEADANNKIQQANIKNQQAMLKLQAREADTKAKYAEKATELASKSIEQRDRLGDSVERALNAVDAASSLNKGAAVTTPLVPKNQEEAIPEPVISDPLKSLGKINLISPKLAKPSTKLETFSPIDKKAHTINNAWELLNIPNIELNGEQLLQKFLMEGRSPYWVENYIKGSGNKSLQDVWQQLAPEYADIAYKKAGDLAENYFQDKPSFKTFAELEKNRNSLNLEQYNQELQKTRQGAFIGDYVGGQLANHDPDFGIIMQGLHSEDPIDRQRAQDILDGKINYYEDLQRRTKSNLESLNKSIAIRQNRGRPIDDLKPDLDNSFNEEDLYKLKILKLLKDGQPERNESLDSLLSQDAKNALDARKALYEYREGGAPRYISTGFIGNNSTSSRSLTGNDNLEANFSKAIQSLSEKDKAYLIGSKPGFAELLRRTKNLHNATDKDKASFMDYVADYHGVDSNPSFANNIKDHIGIDNLYTSFSSRPEIRDKILKDPSISAELKQELLSNKGLPTTRYQSILEQTGASIAPVLDATYTGKFVANPITKRLAAHAVTQFVPKTLVGKLLGTAGRMGAANADVFGEGLISGAAQGAVRHNYNLPTPELDNLLKNQVKNNMETSTPSNTITPQPTTQPSATQNAAQLNQSASPTAPSFWNTGWGKYALPAVAAGGAFLLGRSLLTPSPTKKKKPEIVKNPADNPTSSYGQYPMS